MDFSNGFSVEQCDGVEVIIKVTERCNINCTYCYMFNRGNEDFASRPVSIEAATVDRICDFLKEGIVRLGAKRCNVVLHGGEPLMMKKRRFSQLCEKLRAAVEPLARLRIGIQTNATLVDDEWIDILHRHDIDVGISLDGPPAVHNRYRVDKAGKGTYDRTVAGVERLRQAYNEGRLAKPGVICVIDPDSSAREVYQHLVEELAFTTLSFNLPMETMDSIGAEDGEKFARYLVELFETWTSNDNPQIQIRLFDQLLRYISGDVATQQVLPNFLKNHVMVVIADDGDLSEHDDFKVINFAQREGNVRNTSLHAFANSPLRQYLSHVVDTVPKGCADCDWWRYCRAGVTHGLTVSRYSAANGFDNRSSLCQAFTALFEAGASYMMRQGLPIEVIEASLGLNDDNRSVGVMPPPAELFSKPLERSLDVVQ